jgi:nitrogen regulatory protein PII
MKMIVSTIRTSKFPDLKHILLQTGNTAFTVYPVSSCYRHASSHTSGTDNETAMISKMRIEIAAQDEQTAGIIDIIRSTAGIHSDNNDAIAVYDLAQCIRISTGEQGTAAL